LSLDRKRRINKLDKKETLFKYPEKRLTINILK
jgi:hypothetical protein